MFRNLSIVLAIIGLGVAVYVVTTADQEIPSPPPAYPASVNPFPRGIVALGIVECSSRDIAAAPPEPGRVAEVLVNVGDPVTAGQPLFRLDGTPLEAELMRAAAAHAQAAAELARLERWPRPEDVAPIEARARQAKVLLDDARDRLDKMLRASADSAASIDEISRQRFTVAAAEAAHQAAAAELARWTSGSWSEDLNVARASLAARQADIDSLNTRLDHLLVRSPIAGVVLKRSIDPGEFAPAAPARGDEPILIGDLATLHVRAQVDEEDTPLLRPGAQAQGRIRGPLALSVPLTMLRIEPYARAKQQVSNTNTELIDTRVVEVIFRVEPGAIPDRHPGNPMLTDTQAEQPAPDRPTLYPGQVVDVFIEGDRQSQTARGQTAP